MSHKHIDTLLANSVVKAKNLHKLWLFYVVLIISCILCLVIEPFLKQKLILSITIIVMLLLLIAMLVLDLIWSIMLISDFSKILANIFPDPSSIEHKKRKFAKNILMAIWSYVVIAISIWIAMAFSVDVEISMWTGILIFAFGFGFKFMFFMKFKDLCGL